jgi:hypothetical protein
MTLADSDNKNKKNYTNKYIRRKPGQADDSPINYNYSKSGKKTFKFKSNTPVLDAPNFKSNMPVLDPYDYIKRKKLIEKLEKLKGPLAYGKNI